MASATTNNWDTVFATDFDVINAAIAAQKTFPEKFDYTRVALKLRLQGTWKSWRLVDGSGPILKMRCLVADGTISNTSSGETNSLVGSELHIEVKLTKIHDDSLKFNDSTATPNSGQAHCFKVNSTGNGGEKAVVVSQNSTFPSVTADDFTDLVATEFANYFNAHISDFVHVFSVAMLNEQAANGAFAWLKPSDASYAVGTSVDGKSRVFGTLCMTDGRTIAGNMQQTIDASILQNLGSGANAAFLISEQNVARHMLLQGAKSVIQGSSLSDFRIGTDDTTIRNTAQLVWGHFQTKHGVISPKIDVGNFTMSLEDDHVLLEIVDATYSPSAGIKVSMTLTQKFGFKTVKRQSDGKFVFLPDTRKFGSPHLVTAVTISEGLKILEISLAVLGVVAALAGGTSAVAEVFASKAVTTGVEGATTAAIDLGEEGIDEAVESLSEEELSEAEDEASSSVDESVSAADNPAFVQRGSFLLTNQFRAYTAFAAAFAGLPLLGLVISKAVVDKQYDKVPAFDDFASNCLGANKWPSIARAELVSVDLRRALVLGVKLS